MIYWAENNSEAPQIFVRYSLTHYYRAPVGRYCEDKQAANATFRVGLGRLGIRLGKLSREGYFS